jgi:NAD(P)-dependent dehydrogenase (short-subunit alcohol dehydrogenase family)
MIGKVLAESGRVDVPVNNAGIAVDPDISALSEEERA